jgi:GNAT superfamily N-acetyltransferase
LFAGVALAEIATGATVAGMSTILIDRATEADAAGVAAVRLAAGKELTRRYGIGTWSFSLDSEDSVRADLLSATVLVARDESTVLGTLKLATKNPYLMDIPGFTPVARPVYLTAMNVLPRVQRQGVGRRLLEEAARVGREMNGEAIRLDSYNAEAGAGEFYRRCGFRETTRLNYNGTPLIFFERLLG